MSDEPPEIGMWGVRKRDDDIFVAVFSPMGVFTVLVILWCVWCCSGASCACAPENSPIDTVSIR